MMKSDDRGRSFLQVMRSTERTPEKEGLCRAVGNRRYPVQVVWAAEGGAAQGRRLGQMARKDAGLSKLELIPGKHFPRKDQSAAMADHIAPIANRKWREGGARAPRRRRSPVGASIAETAIAELKL
jgi:hypothetical protein